MTKWNLPPSGGHMDLPDGIYLQNMSIDEIKERVSKNDVIIIPVGSTENHGPAACIGEDTFLVTRMAELVAEKTGCTVAQPTWYGSHPYHHVGMPGTIIVPEDIFKGLLRAIMAGCWNMGFRKMILLNGHGQEYVIPSAIHEWAKNYQLPAVICNVNWYHAIPEHCKDQEHGGPFETPFIHADEAETSFSMTLFPEMIKKIDASEDNEVVGWMPEGHVDKAGNIYQKPIRWYGQVGFGPIEVTAYPEGHVGCPSKATFEKGKPGMEAFLDYLEKLVTDILNTFPAGKLPPTTEITQRDPKDIEPYIKGPLNGGKSIYELRYPP
ncbi:MAG: creatininase family protein [Candidatus Lokiarchaeota archaeon]|nr:creatininase family protein [Candidatus Lokiarchaeota archaeon]